jgi:lysozyme
VTSSEERERLRLQLVRDEGCRLKVYQDQVGKLSIGIGRNLEDKGISQTEAEYLLDNDIRDATSDVLAHLPWAVALDEARRAVLINLCFNVGPGGLLGFRKMLSAMQAGEWATAAAELLDSKYHRQVGQRAERLARQLETGEWS